MTVLDLGGEDPGAEAAAEAVEAAAEAVEAAAEAVEATAEAAADVAEEASEVAVAEAGEGSADVELHERVTRLEMELQSHIDDYEIHQTRGTVEFEAQMAAEEAVADVVEAVAEAAEEAAEEAASEEITIVEPDVSEAGGQPESRRGMRGFLRSIY